MMKKILLSLLMLMAASCAWAFDVVFVPQGSDGTARPFSITQDGVTLDISQGIDNGTMFRVYKGHSLTITSTVGPIKSIVLECIATGDTQYGPGGFTATPGEYSYADKNGYWHGDANQVIFTASMFQVRLTRITVSINQEVILPPVISPAGGTFYEPVEVSMTAASGAIIHYTTDSSDPSTASPRYTAPFTVDSDMTVKAVAVIDNEISSVATATYRFEAINTIDCLGDIEGLPDETHIIFNHEAQVIYQYKYYLYLKDECGYGLVYGNTGQTYKTGDIIPPGWGGNKTTWDGEPEIKSPTGFKPPIRNEVIVPELITIPDIGHHNWAHYVELRGVFIDQENMVVRDQDGNTIPYYPQLPYQVDPNMPLDIQAVVTSYGKTNTIYQLLIIPTTLIPPPPTVCSLEDLYQQPRGMVVEFECPLTVIYQNGVYLYVKDGDDNYGLIYGYFDGAPFENGDLIIGSASWTTYQGQYQLNPSNDWHKVGHTDPVEPIEMPIEEISADMIHWYLRLTDVSITWNDYSPLVTDETGEIIMYDRFQAEVISPTFPGTIGDIDLDKEVTIADVNALIDRILSDDAAADHNVFGLSPDDLDPNKTYDIDGFVSIYRDQLEFTPIRIVPHGYNPVQPPVMPPDRYDVNGDGEITIADVNCLIDLILSH